MPFFKKIKSHTCILPYLPRIYWAAAFRLDKHSVTCYTVHVQMREPNSKPDQDRPSPLTKILSK
jgi:hypothetical protein